MYSLYPAAPGTPETTIDDVYAHTVLNFPADGVALPDGRKRPFIYINMVATLDGKATSGTRVAGIGSQTDRRAMRLLRAAADAVMNGAETIRRENFIPDVGDDLMQARQARGLSAIPTGIVVSKRGDLPLDKAFFTAGLAKNIVIATDATDPAQQAAIVRVAKLVIVPQRDGEVDLAEALAILYHDLNIRKVLLEGGPTLNYALIAQHLVDELFLTIAPKIFGGTANKTIVSGPDFGLAGPNAPRLTLHSMYAAESELLTRWQFT